MTEKGRPGTETPAGQDSATGAAHGFPSGQAEEWERKARQILATGETPHFAPDAAMLAIHRRQVAAYLGAHSAGGNGPPTALVLGATPELADLAVDEGLCVLSVDRSPAMIEAAARRRRTSDPDQETAIVGDWSAMPTIADGAIDIVLGDASLNNVAHEDMPAVLDEIARVTRRGGLVSLRQIVLPADDVPAYEFPEVLAALRAGRINLHEFDRVLRFYSFVPVALDPVRHRLDAHRVFEAICEKRAASELAADEFDFLMARYSEVRHTVYRLPEQVRVLERLGNCGFEWLPDSCFFHKLMAHFTVRTG